MQASHGVRSGVKGADLDLASDLPIFVLLQRRQLGVAGRLNSYQASGLNTLHQEILHSCGDPGPACAARTPRRGSSGSGEE